MNIFAQAASLFPLKKLIQHSASAAASFCLLTQPVAYASPDVLQGGSSDILQVKAEDADIVARPNPSLLQIVLDNDVYDDLWSGVLDGTFQYLQIEDCRFFVTHSPTSNSLYAYDWLNLQYEVVPRLPLHDPETL